MKLGYRFMNPEYVKKIMFEAIQTGKVMPKDTTVGETFTTIMPDIMERAVMATLYVEMEGPEEVVTSTMQAVEKIITEKGWARLP